MSKDKKEKSGFSKALQSFGNTLSSLFKPGKTNLEMDTNVVNSPGQIVLQNFLRNKLAIFGLVMFILLSSVVTIGGLTIKNNPYETDAILRNLPPSQSYLKIPSELANNNPAEIVSGISFSYGITEEGKFYAWGKDVQGSIKQIPKEVYDSKIVRIAAGDRHGLALDENGKLYAWGNNSFEQGSVPSTLNSDLEGQKIIDIDANDLYSVVLTEGGIVKVWGSTLSTRLDLVPSDIQGRVKTINATAFNVMMILDDGTVAQIGLKGTPLATLPEELTNGSINFVDVAAAERSGIALDDAGNVHVWGVREADGLLTIPQEVVDANIVEIQAGRFSFVVRDDAGNVYSWGTDKYGVSQVPTKLKGQSTAIYSDYYQTYSVSENGVNAWGNKGFTLGSDEMGRDILTRLLVGGGITLFVGAIAVIISTVIGVTVGLISGFYGGWVDNVLMRFSEIISSFPFLPLAITLSALLAGKLDQGQRLGLIMVVLGVISWPGLARLVRGQILAEREKDFVLAARSLGLKTGTIIIKHILPSVVNVIIVNMTLSYAGSLLTEAGLSFLGFGVAAPQPSWGNMLTGAQSSDVIQNYWWRWVLPALLVLIAALSVNLVGDGLRDAMDPKSNEK